MAINSAVMFALGAYRFSVFGVGVDATRRETAWRWASQDVIGAPPALQYIGPGEETVEMKGTIYPHYRGGLGQVDAMRAQAGLGVPLILVDGTGRYYGDFVIEKIGETKSVFMADGAPRKIEFELTLKRFT